MSLVYYILWWLHDRELTFALNTGRSPESIRKLRGDVARWLRALEDAELRARFN